MHSFGATVGGLGVAARISPEEVEALRWRLNVDPKQFFCNSFIFWDSSSAFGKELNMTALQGWIVIGLLVLITQILDLSDELDQADQQKNRRERLKLRRGRDPPPRVGVG